MPEGNAQPKLWQESVRFGAKSTLAEIPATRNEAGLEYRAKAGMNAFVTPRLSRPARTINDGLVQTGAVFCSANGVRQANARECRLYGFPPAWCGDAFDEMWMKGRVCDVVFTGARVARCS